MRPRHALTIAVTVVVLAATFGAGLVVGSRARFVDRSAPADVREQVGTMWEVLGLVDRQFFFKSRIDHHKLMVGAIRGLVDALDDPPSQYLDQRATQVASGDLEGRFSGVGITVQMSTDGKLTIMSVMPGHPAEKAGLRPGDVITKIDGRDVANMAQGQAVQAVRGASGTEVRLTVLRGGEYLDITVVRAEIQVPSVSSRDLGEGLRYVKLSSFGNRTRRELEQALAEQGLPQGIVLDLRNNPGGLLNVGIDVASEFIASGPVAQEEHADGKHAVLDANGRGKALTTPLVVLVNRRSASASEIVAGALQDTGRAPLIGEKTFGKGSVQSVHMFSDGSSLHITSALWLTPKGRQIQGQGLEPDITVASSDQDERAGKDAPLERARDELSKRVAALRSGRGA